MPTYETPGIYDERSDASGGGIAALRTDVTGFVGIAERGPLHLAVPVESTRQFEAWFGRPTDNGYLAYSARAFFENGGRRLWVVRVASDSATPASVVVHATGGPAWRIEASSPGAWGNGVAVRLGERRAVQRRARVDALAADRLHVDSTAGLEPWTLVEVRAGGVRERAVVERRDAGTSDLWLQRPLATIPVTAAVEVDSIAYALDVYEAGELVAQYADLSSVPRHPRYGPGILRLPWAAIDVDRPDRPSGRAPEPDLAVDYFRIRRNRAAPPPPPVVIRELRAPAVLAGQAPFDGAASGTPRPLTGGADGLAALRVSDFVGEPVPLTGSAEAIALARRGIAALEVVDEVALLAVPDIHIRPRAVHPLEPPPRCEPDPCLPGAIASPPVVVAPAGDTPPVFGAEAIAAVQEALVDQCERLRDRVALLDAPFEASSRPTFAGSELQAWRQRFDTAFAGLYVPWVRVVDPLRNRGQAGALTRAIPPSGHVAGQAAATDLRSGVHVAPANVPLQSIQALTLDVGDALHGLLNSSGINVLRAQPGRGLRVLGGRTMSSDPDWRYLNVRRLLSMIEKAIDTSIQWAVFEPNDWATRAKLTLVVRSFLLELWSRGAMVGATPEQGFWVRCDETNNPPAVRDLGQLHVDIGVAPTTPFEFIVLRIGRDANGFAISDDSPAAAAAV
jgi:phage tail sheath protein FI